MNNFTYKDMSKPSKRVEMQNEGVAKLGTKSGGFGDFKTHFVVITESTIVGACYDLKTFCADNNIDYDGIMDSMPSLKAITSAAVVHREKNDSETCVKRNNNSKGE